MVGHLVSRGRAAARAHRVDALAPVPRVPFIFDPQINLLAFALSAMIGVVFGYFPARRAAALNPIDALRYE